MSQMVDNVFFEKLLDDGYEKKEGQEAQESTQA